MGASRWAAPVQSPHGSVFSGAGVEGGAAVSEGRRGGTQREGHALSLQPPASWAIAVKAAVGRAVKGLVH